MEINTGAGEGREVVGVVVALASWAFQHEPGDAKQQFIREAVERHCGGKRESLLNLKGSQRAKYVEKWRQGKYVEKWAQEVHFTPHLGT